MIASTYLKIKGQLSQGLVTAVCILLTSGAFSQGLFFSQYVETNSGSTPKGVEVFNNTGADIVFSATNNLEIFQGTNGGNCTSLVDITTGILENGKVWVIGTADIMTFVNTAPVSIDLSGSTAQSFVFNGDDALQLYLGGVLMDVIGECGDDPGASWTGSGVSTANQNIQSIYGICSGSTVDLTNPSTRFETVGTGSTLTGFGVAPKGCPFWTGSTSIDWDTGSNWSSSEVPSGAAKITIPSSLVLNSPVANLLTINTNSSLTIQSGANLTVSGALTNDGTITIESGATLVQGAASTVTGTGNWNVEQDLIGNGTTSSITGRFYYMGSPVSASTSAAYNAAGVNRAWSYSETAGAFTEITDNTTSLIAGQGYGVIVDANETISYTGGLINNGTLNISGLTRTGTTAPKEGYNMVSNPYPSYLDWSAVTKTNIDPTIWFQTKDGAGNKVFDTYNATSGIGVSNSGGTVNQYIAPMQGFWVLVSSGTGTLGLDNSMRSHQPTGSGLKSQATDFPAFVRLNLHDGTASDETVVFFHENAQNTKDAFDSEKMFIAGSSAIFTQVENSKLMMNGLQHVNGTTRSVPLTVDFNGGKTFTVSASEIHMVNGTVFLEDKRTQTMHNLMMNDTYTFTSTTGLDADRFVLHFQANAGLSIAEATQEDVAITADLAGNVTITVHNAPTAESMVTVLDAAGRIVSQHALTSTTTKLKVNENNGMYFVRVNNGRSVVTEKIILSK